MTVATKLAAPVAKFLFHENHTLVLRSDNSVTCDTCSIPATAANAVVFMKENGVIKLTLEGAPLKRI